jgi:hypothetical protein
MTDGDAAPAGAHPLEHKWTLWFDNPKGSAKGNS